MINSKNLKENKFLTDLAKKYCDEISAVYIADIPSHYLAAGSVFKYHDEHVILVNREFNICPIRAIWITFHEVCHVLKKHSDPYGEKTFSQRLSAEKNADLWAYREMEMLMKDGSIAADSTHCFPCCQYNYCHCIKEDTREQKNN